MLVAGFFPLLFPIRKTISFFLSRVVRCWILWLRTLQTILKCFYLLDCWMELFSCLSRVLVWILLLINLSKCTFWTISMDFKCILEIRSVGIRNLKLCWEISLSFINLLLSFWGSLWWSLIRSLAPYTLLWGMMLRTILKDLLLFGALVSLEWMLWFLAPLTM